MRILKTEVQGLHEDDDAARASPRVQAAPAQLQPRPRPVDHQAQIDALSEQLANLQQVGQEATDSAQAQ